MAMREGRIDDRPFLGLIRRWLKAGILATDGRIVRPEEGTPQGGVVSPVLANVYLHTVLDKWHEEVVKAHGHGAAYFCRYADDFVAAFQYEADARRFHAALGKRLGKNGLSLAGDKTPVGLQPEPAGKPRSLCVPRLRVPLGLEPSAGTELETAHGDAEIPGGACQLHRVVSRQPPTSQAGIVRPVCRQTAGLLPILWDSG